MKRHHLLFSILFGSAFIFLTWACNNNTTNPPFNLASVPSATNTPTTTWTPTPSGLMVTTFAGQAGVTGSTNATGTSASFSVVEGLATDPSGNVYVADGFNNNVIRKITPAGTVSTFAGTVGVQPWYGILNSGLFRFPRGIAFDPISGNIYVADWGNSQIVKITAGGVASTFAGGLGPVNGGGYADGVGTAAMFKMPSGVAVDSLGNVFVADGNIMIRKITPGGTVSTFIGASSPPTMHAPWAIAIDSADNLFVTDTIGCVIWKVTPAQVITTFAGAVTVHGSADGIGTAARFNFPMGIAIDASDNLYVADSSNSLIRKITPVGVVTTIAGQAGVTGVINGATNVATFNYPNGIALDPSGNIFVGDASNLVIREIK